MVVTGGVAGCGTGREKIATLQIMSCGLCIHFEASSTTRRIWAPLQQMNIGRETESFYHCLLQ